MLKKEGTPDKMMGKCFLLKLHSDGSYGCLFNPAPCLVIGSFWSKENNALIDECVYMYCLYLTVTPHLSLMVEAETVTKVLEFFCTVMQVIACKDFISFFFMSSWARNLLPGLSSKSSVDCLVGLPDIAYSIVCLLGHIFGTRSVCQYIHLYLYVVILCVILLTLIFSHNSIFSFCVTVYTQCLKSCHFCHYSSSFPCHPMSMFH